MVALTDRSRRPVRYANQLPEPIERLIVATKRDKPHWGARKIRELLVRRLAGDVRIPARSTVHAVLDRHGLVKRARARRNRAEGTPLSLATAPNDLWCTDPRVEPEDRLQGGIHRPSWSRRRAPRRASRAFGDLHGQGLAGEPLHQPRQPLLALAPPASRPGCAPAEAVERPAHLGQAGLVHLAAGFIAEVYLPADSARFAKPPEIAETAFVTVADTAGLAEILCVEEDRVMGRDDTVAYAGLRLQLPPSPARAHYVKTRVKVHAYPSGDLAIFHGPRLLARYDRDGPLTGRRDAKAAA